MRDIIEALKHPEYVHVLLNPIPIYVLPTGLALLLSALLKKQRTLQVAALWVLVFVGAAAWPIWYFGHAGYEHLMGSLTDEAKQWANVHIHRADRFIYALYLTGIIGIISIYYPRKSPSSATKLAVITLLIGTGALGLSGWIARAGGEIRHSEFRIGPPPAAPVHKHAEDGGHSH